MNQKVLQYLQDAKFKGDKFNNDGVPVVSYNLLGGVGGRTSRVKIKEEDYYIKKCFLNYTYGELLIQKIYNQLGVPTLQYRYAKDEKGEDVLVSRDLHSTRGIYVYDSFEAPIYKKNTLSKLIEEIDDCEDELMYRKDIIDSVARGIVADACTMQRDRNTGNYMFYTIKKNNGVENIEGIICLDNELNMLGDYLVWHSSKRLKRYLENEEFYMKLSFDGESHTVSNHINNVKDHMDEYPAAKESLIAFRNIDIKKLISECEEEQRLQFTPQAKRTFITGLEYVQELLDR